jgi:ZIP family zinc transporter
VVGYGRLRAFGVAFLTGLVEPVGGLFGSTLVSVAEPLMPWTLGFAAGAMIFIISDEVIPETHRGDNPRLATHALMSGIVVMLALDTALP